MRPPRPRQRHPTRPPVPPPSLTIAPASPPASPTFPPSETPPPSPPPTPPGTPRPPARPARPKPGQIQLGADPQEYRPSDAELVAAEAGDRLSAALQGADEATKTSVTTIVGDARTYKRFDFRRVDVMGSGRYYYASQPREASLPL